MRSELLSKFGKKKTVVCFPSPLSPSSSCPFSLWCILGEPIQVFAVVLFDEQRNKCYLKATQILRAKLSSCHVKSTHNWVYRKLGCRGTPLKHVRALKQLGHSIIVDSRLSSHNGAHNRFCPHGEQGEKSHIQCNVVNSLCSLVVREQGTQLGEEEDQTLCDNHKWWSSFWELQRTLISTDDTTAPIPHPNVTRCSACPVPTVTYTDMYTSNTKPTSIHFFAKCPSKSYGYNHN